jgi:hypothetical protein
VKMTCLSKKYPAAVGGKRLSYNRGNEYDDF